jgi:SHS2 domain-containing protein
MPYQYRDDIARGDVAFTAWGATRDELFCSAAEATIGVMVENLTSIKAEIHVEIALAHDELDLLLYDFLNELIFLKDSKRLLLLPHEVNISQTGARFSLLAKLSGEHPDQTRHHLAVDVKAVTMHKLSLEQTELRWQTTVVLDV